MIKMVNDTDYDSLNHARHSFNFIIIVILIFNDKLSDSHTNSDSISITITITVLATISSIIISLLLVSPSVLYNCKWLEVLVQVVV